jgi:hypothetical protein
MQVRDGFIGFGSNLIFNSESTKDSSFGDDIKNRLSFGRPCGRRLLNFWGHCCIGLGQQTRSPDCYSLAAYECLCPAPGQRLKLGSWQYLQLSPLGLGHDCLSEGVFGVDFYGGSVRKQITLVRPVCSYDSRQYRGSSGERSGLIKNHHVQIPGAFKCEPVLDEETVLSSEGCRDCNHERNRQSEGVWASNNKDGCRPDQRMFLVP